MMLSLASTAEMSVMNVTPTMVLYLLLFSKNVLQ